MTVYIIGGSNSLEKTGWTSRYKAIEPDVVNLSIGAATTLIGLFRVMATPDIGPDDVVIWEYALNDANHLRHGYSPDILLRHLEHFLIHARDRGIAVVPVIFTPQFHERKPNRHRYYGKLQALLNAYGLISFDVSTALRSRLGVETLPTDCYRDALHYAHTAEILSFIAHGVVDAVAQARLPADRPPLRTKGQRMVLVDDFATDTFQNSILQLRARHAPFSQDLPGTGELTAVIFLTHPTENALQIALAPDDALVISTATRSRKFQRPMLKAAAFEVAREERWTYKPGTVLEITQWIGSKKVYAEPSCKRQLSSPSPNPLAQVVGVLVTTPLRRRSIADVLKLTKRKRRTKALAKRLIARTKGHPKR